MFDKVLTTLLALILQKLMLKEINFSEQHVTLNYGGLHLPNCFTDFIFNI